MNGFFEHPMEEGVRVVGMIARAVVLRPPMLPLELQGSVDLGQLAVRGPYAGYLHRVGEAQ